MIKNVERYPKKIFDLIDIVKDYIADAEKVDIYFRDDLFQLFNWFKLFSSGKKLPTHSEMVNNGHLKGGVDGFSYLSLIFSYFIF